MKATYKNTPDEFTAEQRPSTNPTDSNEVKSNIYKTKYNNLNCEKNSFKQKTAEDTDGIEKFHLSQTHMSFIHQYLSHIRQSLKSINEKYAKNAEEFSHIEKTLE